MNTQTVENNNRFIANKVLSFYGYSGGVNTLQELGLKEGDDYSKIKKIGNEKLFCELERKELVGIRASSVIILTYSGYLKIAMQGKGPKGYNLRNYLADKMLKGAVLAKNQLIGLL